MSSVFKLSIKGVRSFDPIETETIEFNKPLTLIVGSNGSGKTSIIECLKFATTGDLPPNSKGGAFIHDPNIGGEKSVIAQIKLAFNNINNKNMILTKTLQLINKKTSNTFKTLENQLVVLNNGERVTISTKAADVEQLVPQFLGVTRSILNYVIFCHQEDSLWPISEPSVLKKRFDEIFDSVKFIKVLENFKELRKQFTEDIKLLTNNVEHLKQDRRRANNKKMEQEDLELTLAMYKEEIESTSKDIEKITSQMEILFKSNQDYELVINKIESLNQQNHSLKNQISKLKDTINFLPDTNDQLQDKLTNFNEIQSLKQSHIDSLKLETMNLNEKLVAKRHDYTANISLEGELKLLNSQYEKNLTDRQQLMDENNLDLSITDVDEYLIALNKLTTSNKEKLSKLIQDNSQIKEKYDHDLQRIRDNRMKESQHLSYYTEDIKSYENTNRQISHSIRSINVDENELVLQREQLVQLKQDFENLKSTNKIATISTDISKLNKEILSLESDIEDLNHQISNSNKQNEIVTRVSFLKEQIATCQKKISMIINDNSERFLEITGKELTVENGALILQDAIKSKRDILNDEIDKSDMLQQEQYELGSRVNKLQSQLDSLREELQLKLGKIQQALPEDVTLNEYDEYCKELQTDLDTMTENINITEVTVKFNEAAINAASKDHYCILCRRGFEDHEVSKFLTMLQEHNDKIKTGNGTKERDSVKIELDDLKSLQNDILRVKELQDTKSEQNELESSKANLDLLQKQVNDEKKLIETLKNEMTSLELFQNVTRELDRYSQEQKSLQTQLQSLNDELYGVEVKSISSLQKEQEDVSLNLKLKRKLLNESFELREEHTKQMNRMELKIKELTLLISNRERELIELQNLRKQQDENLVKLKTLLENVGKSEELIKQFDEELQRETNAFDEWKLEIDSHEREQQLVYDHYRKIQDQFDNITKAIDQFINTDSARFQECLARTQQLSTEITEIESQISIQNSEISNLERELIDADKLLRNIRDNIDIRNLEFELSEKIQEIDELQQQNAQLSRDNYQTETTRLNEQLSQLKSNHLMKTGEFLQINKQIQSIKSELIKDYQNIDQKYNEEYLKLQTKFLVNNDLSIYSKALDSAIMKFHSLKMKEINEIIDQLWRTTYSGSDVDTVLVKSESNTAGVKAGNRSYNYRVVMVKQGVELDMRGRCSAGQKVLASIIIRLLLLECFGINFGMMTLDEPTTNLDEDNIESLAKSLNQIIEMRQRQKNFQLIVITHDEKFLKHMGAAKFTDSYYRVSRSERQTSVIESVPIAIIND